MKINNSAFELLQNLSGTIQIRLTKEPKPMSSTLMNLQSDPSAKVKSVKFNSNEIYENDEFRELSKEELKLVVLEDAPSIKVCGKAFIPIEINAANKKNIFTIKDMIKAIEFAEKQTRGKTQWFGGIDVHHIFFEGISFDEKSGTFETLWGS